MGTVSLALLGALAFASGDATPTWVFFVDKGVALSELDAALSERGAELSTRALARRQRVRGDAGIDARDLPVAAEDLAAVLATGARLRARSRWLNAVSVEANPRQLARIAALPRVRAVQPVARSDRRMPALVAPAASGVDPTYGASFDQLETIGVPYLHACGLTGAGVVVAVLDTGFVLDHVALDHIDVIAAHDFVHGDDVVADEADDPSGQQTHGTVVLAAMAGRDEGNYSGSAPDVSVLLAKTEDTTQEAPVEEDWFVAGLEWAEAMGADISTASLNYSNWYTPDQMDGQTAVTSIAAGVALDNGLIMFNAVGNSGPAPTTMGAPADTDRLISVGAVNPDATLADFSSRGPTADGRIKPDVCAPGNPVMTVDVATVDQYTQLSGTSLAAPLVAGVGALLLQAYPGLGPEEMGDLLRETAKNAAMPNNDFGWGIVDGAAAAGIACTCDDADRDLAYDVACGGDDCDDANVDAHPGASEICEGGADEDCDALVDDADPDCPPATDESGSGSDGDTGGTTGATTTSTSGTGTGSTSGTSGASTSSTTGGDGSESSGSDGEDSETGSGCGCVPSRPHGSAWLFALALGLTGAARSRRAAAGCRAARRP